MILKHLNHFVKRNEKVVLATIIAKEGSSYRQVGAKSIITEDGTIYGVLSGGCIEEDLAEHAKEVFRKNKPKQILYDLRNDEDTPWGMGVGCNGIITIWLGLIDPLNNRREAFKQLKALNREREGMESLTVGTVITSENETLLPLDTFFIMEKCRFNQKGIVDNFPFIIDDNTIEITAFIEEIRPKPNIIIFGAGQDANSVVNQFKQLHWQVTLIDHRPGYLTEKNFPCADRLILTKPGKIPETVSFHRNTFVVVMTHHFENDMNYLKGLIHEDLPYIGLLGPKKRYMKLKQKLDHQGIYISEEIEKRIHTPVGLDIGTETPEEIALSIAAEILSCRNKKSSRSLKYKKDPLHS